MKILFFGDIVGDPGIEAIEEILPKWQKKYNPDLVLANGENMVHGSGINRDCLNRILKAGVDLVTSGDHIWKNKQANTLLGEKETPLLRPANYPEGLTGQGWRTIQVRTKKVLVINLLGRVFVKEDCDDPFKKIEEILDQEEADFTVVDFHAETTSEKRAMGWYLDGRITALLGTHTHIPTADAQILPEGTAYITDVGMVGPLNSVLGRDKESVIKKFLTQTPQAMPMADGPVEVNAVLLETKKDQTAKKIDFLRQIVG